METPVKDVAARRRARQLCKLNRYYHPPVVISSKAKNVCLIGNPPFWTTPSGKTIVHHPSSYGWRTLYHPSTRRVVVPVRWAKRHGLL